MSSKSEADPQLGRTLGGQYRIEALLGAGGMGRVYRGRQLSVNRAVAIKLIAGSAPYPPEWVRRFRREAEATASLSHPNSVRLFDFGVTESEELFMVMELLEGTDLARQLSTHGALPVVTALSVTRQVLLALCEAHALGITHRDIKPDNIFLASVRGADVVAKVMDFGIAGLAQAQHTSRLTGTGVIIGTPLYMSPEQAQGIPVDSKSDLYSLGVVLFEMLTGRPVFESNTAVTLLLAHVSRPPRRLAEVSVQLREQDSLQALLDRLLAKEPAARPSAAEALDSVTALSARLGIASATGSMRAPPLAAARGEAPGSPQLVAAREGSAGAAGSTRASQLLAAREAGAAASGASRTVPPPLALRDRGDEAAAFHAARATGAHTSSRLRPGIVLSVAGLVLTAGTALALRWVPALIDAAQPTAAETVQAAATTPEPELRSVLIQSQPSGAHVLLDGEKVGTTPYELALRRDTEISVAREGYVRQLVTVTRDTASPILVKLSPQKDPKPSAGSTPFFFSFKQENSARIEPRTERTRAAPAAPRRGDDEAARKREPSWQATPQTFEPSVLVTRDPDELRPEAPPPAARSARKAAPDLVRDAPRAPTNDDDLQLQARANSHDRDRGDTRSYDDDRAGNEVRSRDRDDDRARDDGRSYGNERARDEAHSRDDALARGDARARDREDDRVRGAGPLSAAEGRGAGIEAVQEDEVSEIALDDDERAQVSKHYGLRAFGRAIARAVGKLLIPYPDRARRAALAEMPLQYFSFREARAAYKNRELDGTGFQEAVWQLRERRRQKITVERDRYARGELSQSQYEARLDRIWEEFWGRR